MVKDDGGDYVRYEDHAKTIAALQEQLAERDGEVAHMKGHTYCAYCGYEIHGDDGAEKVSEHIKTCEFHPMRELERNNIRLREENRRLRACCGDQRECPIINANTRMREALEIAKKEIVNLVETATERIREAGRDCDDAERTYKPILKKIEHALAPAEGKE